MMRFFVTLLLLLLTVPALAAPRVVVSIAPIHSLVSALTRGISKPQLLLTQGGSPHSASLRPSQARSLSEADLLIWIGPEFETFLTQPVARLVDPEAEMRLLTLNGLKLLPQRRGGFWEQATEHDPDHDQHRDQQIHASGNINPHIWLSPFNAIQIARAVSQRLIQLDPQQQARYQQNLRLLTERIDVLHRDLRERLERVRRRPYLVFHDAYPYFEQAFSLNAVGAIRISAERAPGARRLQQIQARLTESNSICLFSEPQFNPALARRLTSNSDLKSGILDPLGKTTEPAEEAWFTLMKNLAENLLDCLGTQASKEN